MWADSLFLKQCVREWIVETRQIRSLITTWLFFLMLLFVFPLTMKPEPELMKTIAPGLIWIAALLSMLLTSEQLFVADYEHGVIEQWLVSGRSLSVLLAAKVLAHWFFNVIPLLLLSPVMALLFGFNLWETLVLALSLLCGTPALMFLCAMSAAFGVGVDQKGAFMALILIPLTLPVIIFGSGTLNVAMLSLPVGGYFALLLAFSIIALGFLPYVIAGVVRVSMAD